MTFWLSLSLINIRSPAAISVVKGVRIVHNGLVRERWRKDQTSARARARGRVSERRPGQPVSSHRQQPCFILFHVAATPATHCQSQPTQIASKATVGFTSTVGRFIRCTHKHTLARTHTQAAQWGDPEVTLTECLEGRCCLLYPLLFVRKVDGRLLPIQLECSAELGDHSG